MEKLREVDENRLRIVQKEIENVETQIRIVRMIVKNIHIMSIGYLKTVESSDEEISRRLATITKTFVSQSLNQISQTLINLKMHISNASLVPETLSLMQCVVVFTPEMGPTKCVTVRKRIAEFITQAINYIKNNRAKRLKRNIKKPTIALRRYKAGRKKSVNVLDSEPEIIGISDDDSQIVEKKKFHFVRKSVRYLFLFMIFLFSIPSANKLHHIFASTFSAYHPTNNTVVVARFL